MKIFTTGVLVLAFVLTGIISAPGQAQAMNKAELIDAIASEAKLSKADSKRALDGFISETTKALKKGDRISLIGFGSFSVSKRSARTGRNPQTGKEVQSTGGNDVDFFPEDRETASENRHDGETTTLDDLKDAMMRELSCDAYVITHVDERVDDRCGDPREVVESFLDVFFGVIFDTVANGEEVSLGEEFGTFFPASSSAAHVSQGSGGENSESARTGRNPQTGKEIKIPAKNVVKFKAGADLSKSVN